MVSKAFFVQTQPEACSSANIGALNSNPFRGIRAYLPGIQMTVLHSDSIIGCLSARGTENFLHSNPVRGMFVSQEYRYVHILHSNSVFGCS